MFKVNNGSTRHYSSVSFANLEHVNGEWNTLLA